MRIYEQVLGKVSVTPEGNWENKEYNRLCLVRHPYTGCVYLSKKAVPIDIDLDNTEYWMFIGEGITREELNDILSRFSGFIVVTTLPETGDPTKIYLLGPIGTGTDKYEEWIYSNSSWVKIGDTSIDLSDYAKKTDIVWEKGTGTNSIQQKGAGSVASGQVAVAEGSNTVASGQHSHTEGINSRAEGLCAHAEGSSHAISDYSHAEGRGTTNGIYSHAEGGGSTASNAIYAHAEGSSYANMPYSHAEGMSTANAWYSHSEGQGTVTTNLNIGEHAEGNYNVSISGVTQHTVGIGTADNDRKNAHVITTDGKHYIPGIGGYTGQENTEALLNSRQDLARVINSKAEKVFIAIEDSTSFVDIKAAIDAGREVICLTAAGYAHLAQKANNYITFEALPNSSYGGTSRKVTVDNNNNWTISYAGFVLVYDTTNKKFKKSYDDLTYTDVVTAAKIVEDGIATANLISQEDFNVIFN